MNLRPSGYEPDELPDCSTPRYLIFRCFIIIAHSREKSNPFSVKTCPLSLIMIKGMLSFLCYSCVSLAGSSVSSSMGSSSISPASWA